MGKSTAGKAEDSNIKNNIPIANQDWPTLSEITRFQLKNNKKEIDVASVTASIENISKADDVILGANKDEENVVKKPSPRGRKPRVVEKEVVEQVIIKDTENKEVFQMDEGATELTASVTPQTTKPVAPSPTQPKASEKKEAGKSSNIEVTMVAKGAAHLYVKKANEILSPLKFLANNFNKVSMALLNLGIPLLMTWYALNHISIITSQLDGVSLAMLIGYYLIFFIASMVVFISTQTLFSGILSAGKEMLRKFATVGKEVK